MMATLERTRPGLMIELHGRDAAADTLQTLARLGYRYVVPNTAAAYPNAEALLASLPDACFQIVGYPDTR